MKKDVESYAKATATLFSEFKVNFYGSVIKKMVSLLEGKKETKYVKIILNNDNDLFVVPQGDKISLVYGINFQQATDKSIARVFLQEQEDTKRHVKNALEGKYYPELSKPPLEVKDICKDPKYSNGFFVLTFFLKNFNNLKDKMGYFINMRNYIQFHIHSIKTYLHIRMNKKGRELEKRLYDAKIYADEELKPVETFLYFSTFTKREEEKEKKIFEKPGTKVDV